MANRRMFSRKVSESTRFLRMSESARLLYYDLGMEADDEGFVEARNVVRMTGARLETLNELADNKYICILNEYGLCWLTCWFENNYIQSDRRRESIYHEYVGTLREKYPVKDMFKASKFEPDVEREDIDVSKVGYMRVSRDVYKQSFVSNDVYSDVSTTVSSIPDGIPTGSATGTPHGTPTGIPDGNETESMKAAVTANTEQVKTGYVNDEDVYIPTQEEIDEINRKIEEYQKWRESMGLERVDLNKAFNIDDLDDGETSDLASGEESKWYLNPHDNDELPF